VTGKPLADYEVLDEMHRLVAASLSGAISPSQSDRLKQLVGHSDENRDLYLDLISESSMLLTWAAHDGPRDEVFSDAATDSSYRSPSSATNVPTDSFSVPGLSSVVPAMPGMLSSGWPVAYLIATVILGLGLVIGAVTHVSQPDQFAQKAFNSPSGGHHEVVGAGGHGSVPGGAAQSPVVGRITGMVDCRFAAGSGLPSPARGSGAGGEGGPSCGSPVILGDKYRLLSGLLEITYDTGAKVILQGPVMYQVESPVGGFLSVGRITACVENTKTKDLRPKTQDPNLKSETISKSPNLQISKFVVRTPTALVTDLGTEFGVEVDKTGAVQTQVFSGVVRVAVLHKDGTPGLWRNLSQGEAVRVPVAIQPIIKDTAAVQDRFVRQMPRRRFIQDDFNTTHNYLADGAAKTVWNGILNREQAARLDTLPVELDGARLAGRLVIAVPENSPAGWAEPHRGRTFKNAPYLYVDVPAGDFDARVRINSLAELEYSAAGLMARLDNNNFVSVNRNQFPGEHCFATRSELAGIDADMPHGPDAEGDCAVRLVRMGEVFLASFSIDGGQTWTPMNWQDGSTAMHRPDMTGPIQLGLWYGTFNPHGGAATFDDFTVRLRHDVPSGGQQTP
jgi:regulation of enolase protein 1 (concanavalin A-like superfamily)